MIDFKGLQKKLDEAKTHLVGKEYLIEIRLKTLLHKAKTIVKTRARGYNVTYRIRLYKEGKNKFYFWVKKPGTKHKYRVNFEFQGKHEDMLKDDVKCSCTCGYWKFFGPDWNAKENNYKLRKMSDGSPPDIRDPNRENYICKHVYAGGKTLIKYLESLKEE